MKKIALVFPHQLFEENKCLENIDKKTDEVFLVEDYLYFRQYKFHKQKIVLHRASMQLYKNKIENLGFKVKYIESDKLLNRESLWDILKIEKVTSITFYELVDFWLEKDLDNFVNENNIKIEVLETPMFLNSKNINNDFFHKKDGSIKKPFMKTFYEWQRNRFNILMIDKNTPLGGKYSFDIENRKKLPKEFTEPEKYFFKSLLWDQYVSEAKNYVDKNFDENYGNVTDFNYGISSEDSKYVLRKFLEERLENFGIYEDSVSNNFNTINHSILTPYLNIGLITPGYVVKETLKYIEKYPNKIPLNSLEGFLRQIIGWREFMRAMYELNGIKMRTKNFFKHDKKLDEGFWSANTGNLIIDTTIKKTLNSAYNHHIERLMILGNFMLLKEIDPDDVYRWFMELYIDSYDWVMVPNVYGMSQFADGGIFATKPYICASSYILKMSNYKKDGIWDKEFDELFWNFLRKHRDFFSKNIRFKMLLSRLK